MQCHGWSTAIRSFRLSSILSTFTPKPTWNSSRFTRPTKLVPQSRSFESAALANTPRQKSFKKWRKKRRTTTPVETSPKFSPAALARAASQTIRMCGRDKQFGDALYILNSMRFSIFRPRSKPLPKAKKRVESTQVPGQKPPLLLSSTPSSINGYTFINFGQPVPTRLASHSFLHSLLRAGFPTRAASQARLMMDGGIRIRTKTMESILASTVDKSRYPPVKPFNPPPARARFNRPDEYPIADNYTRIAVRLLEEARRRRQERTQHMYDVVINACLLQGEIIVASLLFLILLKDWQLRQALKNQRTNTPPPEPSEHPQLHPTRHNNRSLLERINHTLTTRKDPDDPLFQNAIQALASLAFATDTGRLPSRFMGSLIKVLSSVPKSPALVWVGSPGEGEPRIVNAYKYIHEVLGRLVCDAGGKPAVQRDPAARQKYNIHSFTALLHYCLRHRPSKAHASELLRVMEEKWPSMAPAPANVLLRSGTLLRDEAIRTDGLGSTHIPNSDPMGVPSPSLAQLPLSRWAHIVYVLTLEHAIQYPSEPMIHTPATPDQYTVTSLIARLTATGRGHIVAEKLVEIIPELNLVGSNGLRIPIEERGRCAVSYGDHFFAAVLNALVKSGRGFCAGWVWRLAIEAEKASWVEGNEPWFLPIHSYTCMLQLYSDEGKIGVGITSSRRNSGHAGVRRGKRGVNARTASVLAEGKEIFRAVQARCRFLEALAGRDDLSQVPPALRKFAPDERYFNALLDLYGKYTMGYARPRNSGRNYWRWVERVASARFAKSGETPVHWHPMMAEIVTEMEKYGYKVPEGLRFLLIGRVSCADTGSPEPLRPVLPGPPPKKTPKRIPVLKTRGLPIPRGRPRRRPRHGV